MPSPIIGRTTCANGVRPFITKEEGSSDGAIAGRIAGTYFHGLFDNGEFTHRFLAAAAHDRGLNWTPVASEFDKDAEYDRLAGIVRSSLDMESIYAIM